MTLAQDIETLRGLRAHEGPWTAEESLRNGAALDRVIAILEPLTWLSDDITYLLSFARESNRGPDVALAASLTALRGR